MLKKIFFNGIKAFVPIALTLALIIWIFRNIESFLGGLFKHFIGPQYYFDGLGFILFIVFIFIIGILVNAWVINRLYAVAENYLQKIPLIKTVYSTLLDLINFFDSSKKKPEQRAVLINTKFGKIIGFVTRDEPGGLPAKMLKEDEVIVYLPLSYQIGGLMVVVNKSSIENLDMPVNRAMSMVLTAGMTGTETEKTVNVTKS